eukprot:6766450-Pyramimonas_sp.AAC.1
MNQSRRPGQRGPRGPQWSLKYGLTNNIETIMLDMRNGFLDVRERDHVASLANGPPGMRMLPDGFLPLSSAELVASQLAI